MRTGGKQKSRPAASPAQAPPPMACVREVHVLCPLGPIVVMRTFMRIIRKLTRNRVYQRTCQVAFSGSEILRDGQKTDTVADGAGSVGMT